MARTSLTLATDGHLQIGGGGNLFGEMELELQAAPDVEVAQPVDVEIAEQTDVELDQPVDIEVPS